MKRNERVVKWLNDAKPYLGVLFLQLSNAGSAIISKLALNQGMNPFTFTVYRNVIAVLFFSPFAIYFERPVLNLNLYYIGMRYSTATFAVTMINLVPALTFLLAWIFRVLGAVVIFIGLYLVIWGKSKDQTSPNNDQNDALPIDNKHPQVQGLNKDITVV
nr:WAT1-related protein At2g39510-like [Ipomoea batatas]